MNFTLPTKTANRLKALIMILMAIFFTQKVVSGDLFYYIGPRFSWLSILAVVLLIILAGSYNLVKGEKAASDVITLSGFGAETSRDRTSVWTLFLLSLPLLLGLLPANPLDASAVENRGVSTALADTAETTSLSIAPSDRNVLDWVRAMGTNPDPNALAGQDADLIGFVYRDIRFGEDQFMVARFTLSCCVADATAIGVVVQADNAAEFETDTWVRVTGTFEPGELDGGGLPVLIIDEITPVERPEQPYLYQ